MAGMIIPEFYEAAHNDWRQCFRQVLSGSFFRLAFLSGYYYAESISGRNNHSSCWIQLLVNTPGFINLVEYVIHKTIKNLKRKD